MSEVQNLLDQFDAQVEVINENRDLAETKKSASLKVRKATSEIEKIGKALRKATIANDKA